MGCLVCNKPLVKGQTKFCCVQHNMIYKKQQKIIAWQSGQDEGWSGTGIKHWLREYVIDLKQNKCEICGWSKRNPYSGKLPLEVHHIDGNYKNNKLENLSVLCPNCHSLTDTYKNMNKNSVRDRGRYVGRKIQHKTDICVDCGQPCFTGSKRCRNCENNKRKNQAKNDKPVSREELKNLIRTTSFLKIGQTFSVSDNAIRKWCDLFELPRTKKEINALTDEEWALI